MLQLQGRLKNNATGIRLAFFNKIDLLTEIS